LRAGKAVFVEKPLALDYATLDDVLGAASNAPLAVGFNRRFAPATRLLLDGLAKTAGARVVHVRANAGALPPDSWVHDPAIGGGRLIGEGCHFIDLALCLAGSPPVDIAAHALGGETHQARFRDNFQITLRCADGSLASVLYTTIGHARAGKERVEVFAGGCTGYIDDFRRAEFMGGRTTKWSGAQDKGHKEELRRFIDCVRTGGAPPISLVELEASSRATLDAAGLIAGPVNVPVR
jgi:predicted dehydrogenase